MRGKSITIIVIKIGLLFLSSVFLISPVYAEGISLFSLFNKLGVASLDEPAIDFTLKDVNDRDLSLSKYYGKVILLNFYATWCPNCQEERSYLENLHQHFKEDNFVIISISIQESKDTVKRFVDKNNLTFLNLLDNTGEVAYKYGVIGVPTTFIIDRDAKLRGRIIGPRKWDSEEMINIFKYLLKTYTGDKRI